MKKYLGVKIIQAEPAWMGELPAPDGCCQSAQIILKSSYPHDNISTEWKDGYKVIYEDGYESWSPKTVFEKAYREILVSSNDKLGILTDPKSGEWDFVGHVAKIELPQKSFNWDFGKAIKALKQGKRVARYGWNGKGMFIFMRPADELNIEFVVDKVKSLPKSVKDYYLQDITNEKGERVPVEENDTVKFTAYLCMKAADGTIVNGWLASQTDMLAEDWQIVE